MTFYEELGVGITASAEEIREAYKHLARLLHPDKLQNEAQRRVAECQMRRLNAVYETLSHAEQRRVYDLTLQPGGLLEPVEGESEARDWRWVLKKLKGPDGAWIGAGVIVAILMTYALLDSSSYAQLAVPLPRVAKEASEKVVQERRAADRRKADASEAQIAQLRRRVEEVSAERDGAVSRIGLLEAKIRELSRKQDSVSTAPLQVGRPPPPVVFAAEAGHSRPPPPVFDRTPGFSGTWYFARTRGEVAKDLYPPEFIQTVIQEENGILHGRYRARYLVSDRAISPEVVFQFKGKASREMATIPWIGVGGARGEVKLRLLTPNKLEVAWVANDLGNSLGLAYGTAVLIRATNPP